MAASIDLISLRRRRGQRGAAMVEAAFMFPMFIILFFSMIYAHSYGSTQIEANIQARQLAWTDVMSNCGAKKASDERENLPANASSLSKSIGNFTSLGSGNSSTITVNTNATTQKLNGVANSSDASSAAGAAIQGGSLEGALGSMLNSILGTIASWLPNPEASQAIAKGVISWRLPNNYAGLDPSNSTTQSQTITVPCNLVPQNGGISGLFQDIGKGISAP